MYVFDLCVNGYRIDFPYLTGIEWLLHGDGVRKNERGAPKAVRDGRRQPTLGSVLPVRSSKPTISGQTVVAAEFYGDPELVSRSRTYIDEFLRFLSRLRRHTGEGRYPLFQRTSG